MALTKKIKIGSNTYDFAAKLSDISSLADDLKVVVDSSELSATNQNAVGANIAFAQAQAIGTLANLTTTAKTDLVSAINEIDDDINNATTGLAAKIAEVDQAVSDLDDSLATVAKSGKAADVTVEGDSTSAYIKADTTVQAALLALDSAIKTVDVSGQIQTAIQALDVTDTAVTHQFVTQVSETDGKIAVTRAALTADDIPALTLAKITDAGTAAAATVSTSAIVVNDTATTLPTNAQVSAFVKSQVADLEGAMHFVGVITRNEGETDEQAIARVITNPKSGDVVVMADNGKEYIFVDPDPETPGDESWREVGDEGLYVKKSTTIAGVNLEDDITKAELLTALNVADGAQVNVIEKVKVGDTELTVTDKTVTITKSDMGYALSTSFDEATGELTISLV